MNRPSSHYQYTNMQGMQPMVRTGDWMTTYTGKQFWPLDPRPEEVDIEDIAHALSLVCRFGGHCREFYSVAQHCCYVAEVMGTLEPSFRLHALLHDAAEAYIGDMIRPMKRSCPEYTEAEHKVQKAIRKAFDISYEPKSVKWCDEVVLRNEHRDVMSDDRIWAVDAIGGPDVRIVPISSIVAEAQFLKKYKLYQR